MPANPSYRVVTVGCPNKEDVTFYYHNASAAVAIASFTNSVCAVYTASETNQFFKYYLPGSPFNAITSFVPGSSYIVYSYNPLNITQQGFYTAPATFVIRPGYNFIAFDENSLPFDFDSLSPTDKNNLGIIWNVEGLDCSRPQPFEWNSFIPGNTFNLYTSGIPLSSYYIYNKGNANIVLNIRRKNQYIITQNFDYITTERGDRFVTGVAG